MTNFTAREFRMPYGIVHTTITTKWNNGCGKRSEYKQIDALSMLLVVPKHKSSWDQLRYMFQIRDRHLFVLSMALSTRCINFHSRGLRKSTMNSKMDENRLFKHFPFCIEAGGVTFQRSNRPSGNMQEGKNFFSGKHRLHGYKFEVAVRPIGFASAFSSQYPG